MAIITHDTSGTTGTRSFRRAVVNIYGVEGTVTSPPEWSKMKSKIDFFAYTHEICPHTKRPHLQCYACSRVKMRLRGWINVLKRPENSHPSIQEMIATVFQTRAGNMSVADATGAYTLDTQDVGCISSGVGYGRQLRPLHGRTGVSQLHTMHPRPSKPLLPSSLLLFLLTDQRCLLGCPHYTT
jgi:hypothetical protein